jgi:hypothetical protein
MDTPQARLVRTYTPAEEASWQRLTLPQEECALYTSATWHGGYRWFRSENVTPIEHYRRLQSVPQQKAG